MSKSLCERGSFVSTQTTTDKQDKASKRKEYPGYQLWLSRLYRFRDAAIIKQQLPLLPVMVVSFTSRETQFGQFTAMITHQRPI